MKKAYIFDLDGVLTESSKQHYMAWKKLADSLGIEIDEQFNETLKGVSRMDSLERILELGNKQNDYTESEKVELATKKNEHYLELIKQFTPDNLFVGVKELLVKLKGENVKVALASASKNGPLLLSKLQIADYFDHVVDPVTVKGKPHPDIFLAAMNEFGLSPNDCVGIEDAVAGIDAIKSAGMYAIGIGDKDVLTKADVVYNNTGDLVII